MCTGGSDNNRQYFAAIKIAGVLTEPELTAVRTKIEAILSGSENGKPVLGVLNAQTRGGPSAAVSLNLSQAVFP